jgi:hypothetical protein
MVKKLLKEVGNFFNTALVILGWLSFVLSFFVTDNLPLVVVCQTIARVLP